MDYAIYMLDPEGRVVSWNTGAERIKGYDGGEIGGQHFSYFYTEEDRARGVPAMALKAAIERGHYIAEGWRRRKDGSRFWASVVIDPIYEDGKLSGFAKVTRDLTEQRMAEAAARESEQRFRLLVQSVIDYAIYMLDPEGRVVSWNTGAERIKGYDAGEIVGQHFSRFYTEEDRARGVPAMALETAIEGGHYVAEGWRCRKDGSRFWASVVIDPIYEDGKLIGFAKVTRDLTERQTQIASEMALREERTNRELREQFIAVLGHDLRNPLSAILSGVRLLRKTLLSDRAATVTNMMENSGQRMLGLIDSVLDFARGRLGGGLTLKRTANASVEPALRQVIAELTASAPDRLVEEEFELGTSVNCDLARIAQLFSNLLGNAITHGTAARPIRVRAISGANHFELSVANAGEPIPQVAMDRLFQPFVRGIVRPNREGLGLGLYIAHEIAKAHGGTLAAKSTDEETRFTFSMPLV